MTTTAPTEPAADARADDDPARAVFSDATLARPPALVTPLAPDRVLGALEALARRGRLPGYEPTPTGGFRVALFGEPFDMDLLARVEPAGAGARITFRSRTRAKTPALFAAVLAGSLWPGLPLLDAMIPAAWGWWPTWWWYVPLVIGPVPLVLPRMIRRSRGAATDHLREQLARIAGALDAELDRGPPPG